MTARPRSDAAVIRRYVISMRVVGEYNFEPPTLEVAGFRINTWAASFQIDTCAHVWAHSIEEAEHQAERRIRTRYRTYNGYSASANAVYFTNSEPFRRTRHGTFNEHFPDAEAEIRMIDRRELTMKFAVDSHSHLLVSTTAGHIRPYRPSPNHGTALVAPAFLVLHYTGGLDFDNAVAWLSSRRTPAKASSAHLVIGRAGQIQQLVPFNVRAWHAGKSQYEVDGHTFTGLNAHSIGIELVNPGYLRKRADGQFVTATGGHIVAPEDVILAEHKNVKVSHTFWHAYADQQLAALYDVCDALLAAYPSLDHIVGHDDIAPNRKIDPGPALDVERIAARLLGRNND